MDPFDKGLPVYTFENRCREDPDLVLDDEATKVLINAKGSRDNLSMEMSAFLDFLKDGKGSSDFTDKLQGAVESAREHKEWEVEYMTFRMKIQEERAEAAISQMIET